MVYVRNRHICFLTFSSALYTKLAVEQGEEQSKHPARALGNSDSLVTCTSLVHAPQQLKWLGRLSESSSGLKYRMSCLRPRY